MRPDTIERRGGAMNRKAGNTYVLYPRKRQKLAAMALVMAGVLLGTGAYIRAQEGAQEGTQGTTIDLGTELSPTEYLRIEEGEATNVGSGGARRDPAKELPMKITAPFTIAAVGDIIEPDPITERADPGFQSLIKIIRDADVGFANMETNLVDLHHRDEFPGPISGTVAPKEIGADIRAMGITMMNRANNHSLDGGEAGILSTNAILEENGIVPAGSGRNLDEARAASFMDTPKGRVGLVGMFSIDSGTSDIGAGCCRHGGGGSTHGSNVPGRRFGWEDGSESATPDDLPHRDARAVADVAGVPGLIFWSCGRNSSERANRSAEIVRRVVQSWDSGRVAELHDESGG